jgi:hypothetical protein
MSVLIVSAQSLAADYTDTARNFTGIKTVSYQVIWTSADAVDATVKLQASLDGTNFEDYGTTYTMNAAAGNHAFAITDRGALQYFRIVYSHGSNTTGTMNIYLNQESV